MNTPSCRNPNAASKVNTLSDSWVLNSLLALADAGAAELQEGGKAAATLTMGVACWGGQEGET